MNLDKFVILIILALFLPVIVSAQGEVYKVVFQGLGLDKQNVEVSEELRFDTLLTNFENNPKADYQLELAIVDSEDGSTVYRELLNKDVDLASREALLINSSIRIPENIPSGNYYFTLDLINPSGLSVSSVRRNLTVKNPDKKFDVNLGSEGLYLTIPRVERGRDYVEIFDRISAGSQGEIIIPGSEFGINFGIKNEGSESVTPEGKIKIEKTYSTTENYAKEIDLDIQSIRPGVSTFRTINVSVKAPGTYEGSLVLKNNGDLLLKKSVRIVIAGESANIIRVDNKDDVYSDGDDLDINSTYVGPADAKTQIEDGYMELQVIENDETIITRNRKIDEFSHNPQTIRLEASLDENLKNYMVRMELGEEDEVFDVWKSNYESLKAERIVTNKGTIKGRGVCVDDGICSSDEVGHGCYDCQGYNKTNKDNKNVQKKLNQPKKQVLAIIFVITIILILLIYRFETKKQNKTSSKGGVTRNYE
jgi:hypothetical protein